jgi:Ca-activated chloride channel family protein
VQVDGTAIGEGLANAVYRLKDTTRKSRAVILLSDGENNTGRISPRDAATIAAAKGVKVYTIGMGRVGRTIVPLTDPLTGERRYVPDNGVDERQLQEIASLTHGRYWLAPNTAVLKEVYDEIARLEASDIVIKRATHYEERMALPLALALALIGLEFLLAHTRWRVVGA